MGILREIYEREYTRWAMDDKSWTIYRLMIFLLTAKNATNVKFFSLFLRDPGVP